MNDFDLDPRAHAIIDAGREGAQPTELRRARIRRGVDARLLAGAAAAAATSSALAAAAKIGASVVLVASVAAGGWYVARHGWTPTAATDTRSLANAAAPAPPPSRASAIASHSGAQAPSPPPTVAPTAPAPKPETVPARAAPRKSSPREGLAAEVELLAQANAAVSRGEATRALELLNRYDRTFHAGRLRAERAAAGVLALCAAGRTDQARAAAERFERTWPRSPLAARVATSCARGSN